MGGLGLSISANYLKEGIKPSEDGPYAILVGSVFQYRQPSLESEQSQNEKGSGQNLSGKRESRHNRETRVNQHGVAKTMIHPASEPPLDYNRTPVEAGFRRP